MNGSINTQELQSSIKEAGVQRISVTFVTCVIFWLFALAANSWGPILAPLAVQLHLSLDKIGLLLVAWSTGYLPGVLIGGPLLDRYGPRLTFFVAILLILSGFLTIYLGLLFHILPFSALLMLTGLSAIGGGMVDTASNAIIGTSARSPGAALNLLGLLYPSAAVIISLVDAGLLLLFHNDPGPPLLFAIIFALLATSSLLLIPRQYRVTAVRKEVRGASDKQIAVLLLALLPVLVARTFLSNINQSFPTWVPAYLHVVYGQSPALASALNGLIALFSCLSRLTAVLAIKRMGDWRTLVLFTLVVIGGLCTLLVSSQIFLGAIAILIIITGLAPLNPLLTSIGSKRAGKAIGSVVGLLFFTTGISAAFFSWLLGFLLKSYGPSWMILACLVSIFIGGFAVLGMRSGDDK